MALFMKQDFSPPMLSRRWIAVKCRPNVILHSRDHIISILESGLLFREDSIEVEHEAPEPDEIWRVAGGGKGGWLTSGERIISAMAVGACIAVYPPRSVHRSTLVHISVLAAIPLSIRLLHRRISRGSALKALLTRMREYLALARRAAACLKEYRVMYKELDSVASILDSTRVLLCRQQSELSVLMSRASSALLGNAPWLRADVAWEAVSNTNVDQDLLKIHHAFLVVQSTLLKHIAMAHFVPSAHAQKIYKNYNERLYWLHNVLIQHLNEAFQENFEALDRMYRLLKNYGNKDVDNVKRHALAMADSWLYSDVHSGIARASLELKIALNKCSSLDMFLDSCALNKQELELVVLNKDIDDLIDCLTKCLSTVQSSQIRLRKLQNKFGAKNKQQNNNYKQSSDTEEQNAGTSIIEDREPETRDEVFYFVKTEDDNIDVKPATDITTEPGRKERETTKVVLTELKRKLVKREDLMRERERQALVKTMPELKDKLPEFPRQIIVENTNKKGCIGKIFKKTPTHKLFRRYKIHHKRPTKYFTKKHSLKHKTYSIDCDNLDLTYDAITHLKRCLKAFISITATTDKLIVNRWHKKVHKIDNKEDFDSSGMSEGLSDVEVNTVNKTVNQALNKIRNGDLIKENETKNLKFTKKDLELSPSSSESDFERNYKERKEKMDLLKDVRRHRVFRKKNYPVKRGSVSLDRDDEVDEGLKPVEYSFVTGMAIASVMQGNGIAKLPSMAQEEVFIGDGEVSNDSGNDEDA